MKLALRVIALATIYWALGSGTLLVPAEAKEIPQAPYYYVLDEPGVLTPSLKTSLERLLVEHDRVSGEQVLIAIFNSIDEEDPVTFTNQVFSAWKIGQRGKDNGALLALYWKEHKARIEVGYGLEGLLTDAKAKDILSEILIPSLRAQKNNDAISASAYAILKTIESPLIASGQAENILQGGGGRIHARTNSNLRGLPPGLTLLLIIALFILIKVLSMISAAEAHFTGRGWYKPRPWQSSGSSSGGGFFGGFGGGDGGGFGGFSGGGGSSGGGGASGDW